MRALSRLFRRLFLERLATLHQAGRLIFGNDAHLAGEQSLATLLAASGKMEWVVYAKRPFGGPEAALAYLSRYSHRVAIANSRLLACGQQGVTFRWKDYRVEGPRPSKADDARDGRVHSPLPHPRARLRRIRHYGLLARGACTDNVARARELLFSP
ncbi:MULTISPECIES: transposase [unclassified Bradyrhizobium]|uniref:transposase n=1 Tax=Bradyrhizobium TaxID=374 RepID=UPI0028EB600B|nr:MULTISPECIES: transposase [unclassified Bradyrhizobium]